MSSQILFLGDTTLDTAASYLAGCLSKNGWSFDYVPSHEPLSIELLDRNHQLCIISDYPAAQCSPEVQDRLVAHVRQGANLLMIGGWESFHGLGGDWDQTVIADLLPVEISTDDDRQNCDSPVFLRQVSSHEITHDLPWDERAPLIGGFNRVRAKESATTLLTAERYSAIHDGESYTLSRTSSDPLLVVDELRASRVTALMTDLAPHWVGPLVDWGDERVSCSAPGAEDVEVGNLYFQFVSQLIRWAGQL